MNQYAIVTGASRGIGAGIARSLASAGYDVALCCEKNSGMIRTLSDELFKQYGSRCLMFTGDISDESFVDEMKQTIQKEWGRIDLLVNNAGISHIGLLTDMTMDEWNRVMNVNLTSVFLMCRAFAPMMVSRKSGHIIQISSMWGERGASCEVAYSASKGGVNSFTKALAKELAPSGIAVNAISCGVIDTEMNACFTEEERRNLIEEIPADRMGQPEEIGAAVLGLLSMPYTTGQIIGVDGGI